MVSVFPCVTYFTQRNTLWDHSHCLKWQDYILFMAQYYSIVAMHHFFSIRLSTDDHLGCFLIVVIVNNAVMIIKVLISFQISGFGFLEINTQK